MLTRDTLHRIHKELRNMKSGYEKMRKLQTDNILKDPSNAFQVSATSDKISELATLIGEVEYELKNVAGL